MANNEYCPIIHMGLGLAVTERLNNMFGVSPDLVVAILRDVYSRDNTMNISADTKLTLDDLFESKAMKDVLSDRFGYGESTFVVDTKEELDGFTEAYNQLQKKGYIDANGVVTEGGIKEQESIYNVFMPGVEDDYMLWDRIKRWEDNAGNLHMVVPCPTLSPDASSEQVREKPPMFDKEGEFNKEYDDVKKIEVEKLVREELQGIADFLGKSVDEIRHNKQIMDEVYEKALSKREQRQQQRQTVKENEKPMTAFKNKFADRNMLDFLAETAARRISNTVSRLQDDPEFARDNC